MSTHGDMSTAEVAKRIGAHRQTVLKLIHQGSFGSRGKGFRVLNPDARRPQYRITQAGLDHYERITAA